MAAPESHEVSCHACGRAFDALAAPFCSCLVSERTLVCAHCGQCFCKAPAAYKRQFWSGAPPALRDRKRQEHHGEAAVPANRGEDEVTRPLVLVVDDEPDIQRVAGRVVSRLGYGLLVAGDGEEGLALARRYRPDLVLTDALMPKLDGREMGRRIKEDPETAAATVVVMTALYTSAKYRTEGLRVYKVDDYVAKPLAVDELQALLKKHLG